jgi:predicted MPP superfamily phosphohydrolase
MNKKSLLLIFLVFSLILTLTGCAEKKEYNIDDYFFELDYKDDFKILQLTDIHFNNKDDHQIHYKFMDLTIKDADADLIIITGDLFTFADKKTAIELFEFIDSYGVPWTVCFGNHDEQAYFSIDWLTDLLNHYGNNCLFKDIKDDNVHGRSNFVINLMDGNNIHTQIIVMDSNKLNFSYFGYDYIKESQILWYERVVNRAKELNGGNIVESILYFHIPLPEIDDAWAKAEEGSADAVLERGEKRENACPPLKNTNFFNKILELGSTKAINTGHDHVNNFRIKYKGIYLTYGIKATSYIYYDDDMLGGLSLTVKRDHSLEYTDYFHTYSEVE